LNNSSEEPCANKIPVLTINDFDSINISYVGFYVDSLYALFIKLSDFTSTVFAKFKAGVVGDKKIITAPILRDAITSGFINIEDNEYEMRELEVILNEEKKKK